MNQNPLNTPRISSLPVELLLPSGEWQDRDTLQQTLRHRKDEDVIAMMGMHKIRNDVLGISYSYIAPAAESISLETEHLLRDLFKQTRHKPFTKTQMESLTNVLAHSHYLRWQLVSLLFPDLGQPKHPIPSTIQAWSAHFASRASEDKKYIVQTLIDAGAEYKHVLFNNAPNVPFIEKKIQAIYDFVHCTGKHVLNETIQGLSLLHSLRAIGFESEHGEMVAREFIRLGVDTTIQENETGTFLHMLIANEYVDASLNAIDIVEEQNGKFNYAAQDFEGKTPLLLAMKVRRESIVERLLMLRDRHDIGINLADAEGRTPVMIGAAYGCWRSVRALIRAGADLSLTDKLGHDFQWYLQMNKAQVSALLYSIHIEPQRATGAPHNWLYTNDSLHRALLIANDQGELSKVLIATSELTRIKQVLAEARRINDPDLLAMTTDDTDCLSCANTDLRRPLIDTCMQDKARVAALPEVQAYLHPSTITRAVPNDTVKAHQTGLSVAGKPMTGETLDWLTLVSNPPSPISLATPSNIGQGKPDVADVVLFLPGESAYVNGQSNKQFLASQGVYTCIFVILHNPDTEEMLALHYNAAFSVNWQALLAPFRATHLQMTIVGGINVSDTQLNIKLLLGQLHSYLQQQSHLSIDVNQAFTLSKNTLLPDMSGTHARYRDLTIKRHIEHIMVDKHGHICQFNPKQYPLMAPRHHYSQRLTRQHQAEAQLLSPTIKAPTEALCVYQADQAMDAIATPMDNDMLHMQHERMLSYNDDAQLIRDQYSILSPKHPVLDHQALVELASTRVRCLYYYSYALAHPDQALLDIFKTQPYGPYIRRYRAPMEPLQVNTLPKEYLLARQCAQQQLRLTLNGPAPDAQVNPSRLFKSVRQGSAPIVMMGQQVATSEQEKIEDLISTLNLSGKL